MKNVVGTIVKSNRIRNGLTQAAVAEVLGLNVMNVSLIETGKNPLPAKHLVKLSRLLKVPKKTLVNAIVSEYHAYLSSF